MLLRLSTRTTTIAPFYRSLVSTFALFSTTNNDKMTSINSSILQVKLLSENATLPTKGSPLSAGFDLAASEACTIAPGGRRLVKTDISIACPIGTYARIAPRSGLAYKKGIDVGAGVVDADYRGPVGVILFNFGTEEFVIAQGDRIAQLILEQYCVDATVQTVEELDDTQRGVAGFGSTGIAKKQRTVSPTEQIVQETNATTEQ
jgi:dUTP pyrophosphatase